MKKALYILGGLVIGVLLTYFVMNQLREDSSASNSHVIAYEIRKLNKMIVAEQMFSDVYSHKNSRYVPGLQDYFSFDKKVLFLVNAKVQAVYDLKNLEVEIDSANQAIIIRKVPKLEVNVYPDVKIYDMEQSTFNSFDKDELNAVQERAVAHINKTVDKARIEKEAHQQLIENLGELYLLAKTYHWKVIDQTPYAKELSGKYH